MASGRSLVLGIRKRYSRVRITAVVGLGLVAALSIALAATASTPSSSVDRPVVTVTAALHHDVSQPLRTMKPTPVSRKKHLRREQEIPIHPSIGGRDTVVQSAPGSALMPSPSANFEGVGTGLAGSTVNSAPPDTNGDVGPNHYVQTVNTQFAIFSKTGAVLMAPRNINTLWSGFGGGCQTNNDGDPTVIYDPIADRWIISQFSVTQTPYLQCVAVSATGDPTGSYYRYSFSYGNGFPDYPKMGVWPDGYYVTYNMFTNGVSFAGAKVCAFDRTKMLTGAAATQQCFNTSTTYGGLLASDLDGATLPPAGAPNYVVGLGATSGLAYWKFHVDWATPASSTFTGPTALSTAAYSMACGGGTCVTQAGTTQKLDSLADRVMNRLAYRNFGDHEALVVNHSVTAGTSSGVRWYELRVGTGNSLGVYQQGTYAPDASYRWMGSIATDRDGNMGLGFSVSSSALNPQIHYTGRLAGDPLGTMPQGEGTIVNGTGSQNGNLSRWGDYASMSVDPVDDCTFYFTTEYLAVNGSFNWRTRIGSFKFPGCGAPATNDFSMSANPSSLSLAPGASGTSTISTTLVSGSAETINLAAAGAPAGTTATLSPTSVTTGGSSTLTISVGAGTVPGTYPITVTGTAPSATHSVTVNLTVSAPPPANDFTISASPSSLSVQQGASGNSTISTTLVSGTAETISLAASGVPSGATATFNPPSVTAGNSSTMTVNTGTAAAGNYTITITGTAASATHSTTVALTVTAPPPPSGVVQNGGFETGSLSPWTASGLVSPAITSPGHTGNYAARLGSSSAFNGNSTLTQTVTIPTGTPTLTFWYSPHCADTITYDQIQMQIRKPSGRRLATVLDVCSNTGTWTLQTYNIPSNIAGRTVVLWFNVHDDGAATDPTYALFDDVAIN